MRKRTAVLLRNFPIPEWYVIFLAAGRLAHAFFPSRLLPRPWMGRLVGWPLILAGVAVIGWSLWAARDTDVAKPRRLLTTGPYARSRNPMYVAWTCLGAGTALVTNSISMMLALPPAVALTYRRSVLSEERALEKTFGQEYAQYKANVRRWL